MCSSVQSFCEAALGVHVLKLPGVELDVNGVARELAIGLGGSHDDGALERERFRLIEDVASADAEAGAFRETRDGVGHGLRQASDTIAGEDTIVQGECEQAAIARRRRQERGSGRINEGTERAGERRFAACGRAGDEEDRVWSGSTAWQRL